MIKGEVNVTTESHLRTNYLISKIVHENLYRDLHEAVRQALVTNPNVCKVWGETQKGILLAADDTLESILNAVEDEIYNKIKLNKRIHDENRH